MTQRLVDAIKSLAARNRIEIVSFRRGERKDDRTALAEEEHGEGLPQIWFGDKPNHQIFKTPTDVVIVHEMY